MSQWLGRIRDTWKDSLQVRQLKEETGFDRALSKLGPLENC